MNKIILLLLLLTFSISVFAQDDPPPPPQQKWLPSGVLGLNLSQIALENWSTGGESSLAFTLFSNFGLDYFSDPWSFTNKLKISYGRTKLGSDEYKTTDNELFLENLLTYDAGWFANPYISNAVRTAIAKGFDYSGDQPVQISNFFDPGYINQSIGLAYKVSESFHTRLGLGFQETITNDFRHYTDPENFEDTFKFETGIETVSNLTFNIDEDLLFTSELRLFGAFDKLDVWDVRWDNLIVAKVTNLINVNLNVLLVYDADQTLRTQVKEALQIGITYTLF